MIRLLGTLVGSALAIALLLLLVGIPQFRAPTVDLDTAIVTLPLKTAPVESPSLNDVEFAAAEALSVDAAATDPPALADALLNADEASIAVVPDGEANPATVDPDAWRATHKEKTSFAAQPGWHTFWSPFRSEIAAQGFVARLQSVTGLDYRINKIEIGIYEVAFAYEDESEIPEKLARISAATGLELASR